MKSWIARALACLSLLINPKEMEFTVRWRRVFTRMRGLFRIFIAFQGKIVGRGVLIDYYSYAKENGIQYYPIGKHLITAQALEACAKAQGLELRIGDILFIRMGYVHWYENASEEERVTVLVKTYPSAFAGIRQGREEVEWLWCVARLVVSVNRLNTI